MEEEKKMAAQNIYILGKSLMDRIEWLECIHSHCNELYNTYLQTTVREKLIVFANFARLRIICNYMVSDRVWVCIMAFRGSSTDSTQAHQVNVVCSVETFFSVSTNFHQSALIKRNAEIRRI